MSMKKDCLNNLRKPSKAFSKDKPVDIPVYNIQVMLNQAISLAKSSGFIDNNCRYKNIVSSIHFNFFDVPVLNSFAYYDESENSTKSPAIATFTGLCLFMGMFSAIFTELKKNKNVGMAKKAARWIADNMITNVMFEGEPWTALDMNKIDDFYGKFSLYANKDMFPAYKELMFKMMFSCLSHEIGHICLGHLDGLSDTTETISRNQEREADSFSCSVLQGTNVGSDFLAGEVLMMISFLYLETKDKSSYGTHPIPRERINNILTSFAQEIEAFGIDISDLQNFMRI